MKIKPTITAKEWERISAELGLRIAHPGHPLYREPPSVALFSGNLVPGIVSDKLAAPVPEAPEPTSPSRDPLSPPLRAEYWDDESYEEARGYWNNHIGRVLALRRGYRAPIQASPASPADPGQPT